MSEVADGIRRGFTVSLFSDNWYKINDYLAAKVLLQVKSSSPTAVPFENVGTGADTRWHICDPGGQRLGGQGLAVIAVAFP